jgi:hypothetical protein
MRYVLAFSLSMILIICGIMGFRYYLSQDFGRADAGVHGALTHGPSDILFIGSSHTYLSYDVAAIERTTGHSAYLIGYNGLQLSSMAPILDYMLADANKRPKEVVVEAYSSNLAHPPTMSDSRVYFESPPGLKKLVLVDYLRQHPGLDGYTDMFDLAANRGNEQILLYGVTSKLVGRNTYHGAGRTSGAIGVSTERFEKFRPHVTTGAPNETQLMALRHIIELARRTGVQLLFVESPMPRPVSQSPDIQSLKRVFREETSRCDLPYLDGDTVFPNDEPQFFEDDNHLSGTGREKFTAIVARFLMAHQPANTSQVAAAAYR